jgi:hypothetical protein
MSELKTKAPKKAAPKKKSVSKKSTQAPPTREDVERLAYQYWVERGRHHGDDALDWSRAENGIVASKT